MSLDDACSLCDWDGLSVQIRKGHLVFDPFAGTGSILIAAAHLGAYTLGTDIDIRVLRDGKTTSDGQVHAYLGHVHL